MTRTKILATLGPASNSVAMLTQLFKAGVDVVRLNFSHGSAEQHIQAAQNVRVAEARVGKSIGILADLQGPKIRVAQFVNGQITLKKDAKFELSGTHPEKEGNDNVVAVEYPDLIKDCQVGNVLLLDDGLIKLTIDRKSKTSLFCTVEIGGVLKNNKGINLSGGGLSAPALTEKDIADLHTIAKIDADFVALSFVKSPDCIQTARKLLAKHKSNAHIVSKIERVEAVEPQNLEQIVKASDVIMIARGDLAVEVGDAALLGIQKNLIKTCLQMHRSVIVATQMMESMINNPVPTRAEVMDVANAVIDGTDAVMLSAESAVGKYPVETVAAMRRIIRGAEKNPLSQSHSDLFKVSVSRIDEVIALAAMFTVSHHKNIAAVICLTSSGNTPTLLSRFNSVIPIYAFSRNHESLRRMTMVRNVYPFDASNFHGEDSICLDIAIEHLMRDKKLSKGEFIIKIFGNEAGKIGGTNSIQISKI